MSHSLCFSLEKILWAPAVRSEPPLMQLEGSVERIPSPPTLTFDLSKFNHLVPCGQGYDRSSLVTIGLE